MDNTGGVWRLGNRGWDGEMRGGIYLILCLGSLIGKLIELGLG